MVLYVNKDTGLIYGWNDLLPQSEMSKYKDTVWYDGNFDFENVETVEGKIANFYLTPDNEIEVRYEDDPNAVELEPTEAELAQAEMLLMQSGILANQNAQDEVLAEILLNQMEV